MKVKTNTAPATPAAEKKSLPSPSGSSIKKKKQKQKQKQKAVSPGNAADMERKKALKLRNLPFVPKNKEKALNAKRKQLEKKLKIKQEREAAAAAQSKKKKKNKQKTADGSEPVVADEVKEEADAEESAKKARALEKVAKFREKLLNHPVQKLIKKGLAPSEDKMRKNIVKAVAGVIAATKHASEEAKKDLFDDPADVRLFLRATVFKNPKLRSTIKATLPHPFLIRAPGELPAEVCLFVKDLERDSKSDPEEAVQHYTELLSSKGIETVKRVIPLREIRNEFNHFKLRTGLARQYDIYLADRTIVPMAGELLGKQFAKLGSRRLIGIDMNADDLKAEIHSALSKAYMPWKPTSDQASMWVGCSSQPQNHLVENVAAAVQAVKTAVKGGWPNIKTLGLQTNSASLMVPVYISMSSGNMVKVNTSRKGAKENGVAGPLTTHPGTTIAIDGHGQIKVERAPVETARMKKTFTPPQTMIPSLDDDGKKKKEEEKEDEPEEDVEEDDDFDMDDEELKEPGKLVKLEHAFLKRKMMSEQKDEEVEEKDSDDKEEEVESAPQSPASTQNAMNTSSSLEGVKKRRKRKRKVNVEPLAGPEVPAEQKASPSPQKRKQQNGLPKSPTPDYSVLNVEVAAETPKAKKKRLSEEAQKTPAAAKPKSPTPDYATPQNSGKKGKKSVTPQQPTQQQAPSVSPGRAAKKDQKKPGEATPQQATGKKGKNKSQTGTPMQSAAQGEATPQQATGKKGKNKPQTGTPMQSAVQGEATPQQATGKKGKNKMPTGTPLQPAAQGEGTPQQATGKKGKNKPQTGSPMQSAAQGEPTPQQATGKKGKNKPPTGTPLQSVDQGKNKPQAGTPLQSAEEGKNKPQEVPAEDKNKPQVGTPLLSTAKKGKKNKRMTQTPQVGPSGAGPAVKGRQRPRSILKRTSTVVTPAKTPGKSPVAKITGSADKAEHGRRVRFSLPKDHNKKNRRKTMF